MHRTEPRKIELINLSVYWYSIKDAKNDFFWKITIVVVLYIIYYIVNVKNGYLYNARLVCIFRPDGRISIEPNEKESKNYLKRLCMSHMYKDIL